MGKKGLFIAFEGIDGCGKSTQIKKFIEYLFSKDKNNNVFLTRNPYKDINIREVIRQDEDPTSKAEKLAELFIEDRKKQAEEVIIPITSNGSFVVSDRYKLSTITYQSAQGIDINSLIEKHKGLPIADITFVIDVPAQIAEQRMNKDGEREKHRFEKDSQFLEKVRMNYFKAKELLSKEKIFIINGNRTPEEIFEEIKVTFERESQPQKKRYDSMEDVPDNIQESLKKYFTNVGGNTFVIHGLPPELTGGALARYSRAPTGMQLTIINEFLDEFGNPSQEKGSELMDRVLNAYGDDSVGELEGAHVGLENISQLLTKTIEDRRIGGSPIEQSTRYVKYDQKDKQGRWRYLRPKEIMETPLAGKFEEVNDKAFDIYSRLVQKLIDYFKLKMPEESFQIEVERMGIRQKVSKKELMGEAEEKAFRTAYNFTVRCAALDVGRCVLPSSTLTHIGIFGNGRFWTNVITALKSGPLQEEKERGAALENELKKTIPTFIKRNREDLEITSRYLRVRKLAKDIFKEISPEAKAVSLVKRGEYLDELIAYSLFAHTNLSLQQVLEEVKKMSYIQKIEIMNKYLGERKTRRDRSGRGFEAGYPIVFDLVGCFAEYRDLQRHRILSQQRQMLTTDLGFIMPPEVIEVGMGSEVESLVKDMESLNHDLRKVGLLASSQYATLFNHRLRFVLGMNLREFQHLSELRTQPAGHFSYRAMVMEMARQVQKEYPWAAKAFQFVDYSDPDNKITRAKEQARIAGKNLASGIQGDADLV